MRYNKLYHKLPYACPRIQDNPTVWYANDNIEVLSLQVMWKE